MKEKITKELIESLAKEAYETAKAHGFHDKEHSEEHVAMLVITEIAEAVNADRKNKHADKVTVEYLATQLDNVDAAFIETFKTDVKDTVEDELADAAIRILDSIGVLLGDEELYQNIEPETLIDMQLEEFKEELSIPFSEQCFIIIGLIFKSFDDKWQWRLFPFYLIFVIARLSGIDLLTHIRLKMAYNKTRDKLHGKKY